MNHHKVVSLANIHCKLYFL